MRIILSDFISLDGVVQAPGGKDEDTDGEFQHGGWSMLFFDPESMGAVIGEDMARTEALLFGRRTWDGMAAAWPISSTSTGSCSSRSCSAAGRRSSRRMGALDSWSSCR
jgi:dihydrofolate reductase